MNRVEKMNLKQAIENLSVSADQAAVLHGSGSRWTWSRMDIESVNVIASALRRLSAIPKKETAKTMTDFEELIDELELAVSAHENGAGEWGKTASRIIAAREALVNAIKAALLDAVRMRPGVEWTSPKEWLPKPYKEVQIRTNGYEEDAYLANDGNGGLYWRTEYESAYQITEIDEWRELPEATP
jgi:hypothetical protein